MSLVSIKDNQNYLSNCYETYNYHYKNIDRNAFVSSILSLPNNHDFLCYSLIDNFICCCNLIKYNVISNNFKKTARIFDILFNKNNYHIEFDIIKLLLENLLDYSKYVLNCDVLIIDFNENKKVNNRIKDLLISISKLQLYFYKFKNNTLLFNFR